MLLCVEVIVAEAGPHITMQHLTTFQCSLGALSDVSVL